MKIPLILIISSLSFGAYADNKFGKVCGSDTGATEFHYLAARGDAENIQKMINAGQPVDILSSGRAATALHYAVYNGMANAINVLIANGANLSAKDKCGLTPMVAALSNSSNDIASIDALKVLVAHGADINERGEKGETILSLAIKSIGRFSAHAMPDGWGRQAADTRLREFVAWAIDNNANVNAPEPVSQATPLHYATIKNEKELVALLIKAGANVNAKARNNATPLSVAIKRNYQEVIDMLRQSGASDN